VTPTLFNVHTTSHKLRRERVIIKVERLESLRNYSFKWIPPFMYVQGGILHEPHCLFCGACFLLDRRSLVLGLLDRDHLKPSWATLGKTDQSDRRSTRRSWHLGRRLDAANSQLEQSEAQKARGEEINVKKRRWRPF
jgi:hypothetical protein